MSEQKEIVDEDKQTDEQNKPQIEIKQTLNESPDPQENKASITEKKQIPSIETVSKNSLEIINDPKKFEQMSLSQAKKLLRQIEEEQQILNNRVELLEVEKSKMDKNINQTQQKTSQILTMKQQHLVKLKERENSEKTQQEFRAFLQEKVKQRKKEKHIDIKKTLLNHKKKQRDLIQSLKQENMNMIQQQKIMSLQTHKNQASIIKNFEEMKKKELKKLRENQINLIMKENQLEIQKLSQLATQKKLEMLEKEKQEQNLMMQLQKTQLVQKDALEKLENAFTMPVNEENCKNIQEPLVDSSYRIKTYRLKKSKTHNKIKLQSGPSWNSSTVIEKLEKPSLLSFLKQREKRPSYVVFFLIIYLLGPNQEIQ